MRNFVDIRGCLSLDLTEPIKLQQRVERGEESHFPLFLTRFVRHVAEAAVLV